MRKTGVPLRPIVSGRGTMIYGTAKEFAMILKPLIGQSPYHVQNTTDLYKKIKNIKLQQDKCISVYVSMHSLHLYQ